MKRWLLCMFVLGILFPACKKETNDDDFTGNNTQKHLSKVTLINDHGECVGSLRIDWAEDRLNHIYITKDGYLSFEITLSYNVASLNRAFAYNYNNNSGKALDFIYTDGILTNIRDGNSDGISLSYQGNNLSVINGCDKLVLLSWFDGEMSRINCVDDIDVQNIEYDNRNNPLNEIFSIILPNWNCSINNPTKFTLYKKKIYQYYWWSEEQIEEAEVNVFYEYSNDYPAMATITKNNSFVKAYIEYTDGTGAKPPISDKYIPKNARKYSLIPLPNVLLR